MYSKFRNFCDNFIFANSFKRQFCQVKNVRPLHDLPALVEDKGFLHFREFFFRNFADAEFSEIKPSRYLSLFILMDYPIHIDTISLE